MVIITAFCGITLLSNNLFFSPKALNLYKKGMEDITYYVSFNKPEDVNQVSVL